MHSCRHRRDISQVMITSPRHGPAEANENELSDVDEEVAPRGASSTRTLKRAHTHTHNANAREEVYSLLRCAERMTKYTHTHTGGTARRVRGFVREQACLNGRRRCVYTHSVCGFTQRTYVNMCICMYYICSMYTQTMFVLFTLKSKLCSDLI